MMEVFGAHKIVLINHQSVARERERERRGERERE